MSLSLPERLRRSIRTVPDFPKPGIQFRDITSFLLLPDLVEEALEEIWSGFEGRVDLIAGIESRGFILGGALALRKRLPFVPLRKPGKLPADVLEERYQLEYGSDALQVHVDDIPEGVRVLLIDDLLATGGTAAAAARLIERAGGQVTGLGFLVELPDLRGREKLHGREIRALIDFAGD